MVNIESNIIITALGYLAVSGAGAKMMEGDLENRVIEKLERARQLPRKQKKKLKKDAVLDWSIAQHCKDVNSSIFDF